MPKSPEEMAAAMLKGLVDRTGKTLEEWMAYLKGKEDWKHGQVVSFLKTEEGLGHGYAGLITQAFLKGLDFYKSGDEEVDLQYAGPKADLRPLYDKLVKSTAAFGQDVEISPKKTYVSLRRSKQFATIRPATKTRMDIGINLKGRSGTDRLQEISKASSMTSHLVSITNKSEIDTELLAWLQEAYEKA